MPDPLRLIVAGIGTEVGKTVVSAILADILEADYWKPINCSVVGEGDVQEWSRLLKGTGRRAFPSILDLPFPVSPHYGAELTHQPIPECLPEIGSRPLVIEMAGGVLVPIDKKRLLIDLVAIPRSHWIVVSRHYLGSINHTLMTVEALRKRGIEPLGIVFNGARHRSTEEAILNHTGLMMIGRVEPEAQINQQVIKRYSTQWKQQYTWKTLLG